MVKQSVDVDKLQWFDRMFVKTIKNCAVVRIGNLWYYRKPETLTIGRIYYGYKLPTLDVNFIRSLLVDVCIIAENVRTQFDLDLFP